jgi:YVTN family beta-propeller protein
VSIEQLVMRKWYYEGATIFAHVEITRAGPRDFFSRHQCVNCVLTGFSRFRMLRFFILLAACALPMAAGTARADTSPIPAADYTVSKSWRLGGNTGWDCLALDAPSGRLFITRDERVDVIETVGGKLVGNIPHTGGVHGVAFAPALKRGFSSNGRTNTVSVFELDTLHVIQEVAASGTSPDAILYEPQQNHIFTANRESANLTVIDAGTLQVVATVALPGPPESMATDEAGHVYVNIDNAPGRIVLVDAKSFAVKANWPLKECANPSALAFDAANHRLFTVCANQVMAVTDSVSGKSIAQVIIGRGSDGAAFDPELGLVFSSNGIDGTLTVIHQDSPNEYRVIVTVTTQVSARTLALDPVTHKIYMAAAQFGPPPAATEDQPRPRAPVVPDTFLILVAQPK